MSANVLCVQIRQGCIALLCKFSRQAAAAYQLYAEALTPGVGRASRLVERGLTWEGRRATRNICVSRHVSLHNLSSSSLPYIYCLNHNFAVTSKIVV